MKWHAFQPEDREFSEDHGLEVPAACGRWYLAERSQDDADFCKVCASKVGAPPGFLDADSGRGA